MPQVTIAEQFYVFLCKKCGVKILFPIFSKHISAVVTKKKLDLIFSLLTVFQITILQRPGFEFHLLPLKFFTCNKVSPFNNQTPTLRSVPCAPINYNRAIKGTCKAPNQRQNGVLQFQKHLIILCSGI